MSTPLLYEWNGEAMAVLPRFAKEADKFFVIGQTYKLAEIEDRSLNSHRQYFASLHEAWLQLPEAEAQRFPSSEHLRKWALIQGGFRDERQFVASSKAEATRLASWVRHFDEYAVIVVREATVTALTAKSQSMKAMGKADFQRSKESVLEIVWALVGITPEEAAPHVGQAA